MIRGVSLLPNSPTASHGLGASVTPGIGMKVAATRVAMLMSLSGEFSEGKGSAAGGCWGSTSAMVPSSGPKVAESLVETGAELGAAVLLSGVEVLEGGVVFKEVRGALVGLLERAGVVGRVVVLRSEGGADGGAAGGAAGAEGRPVVWSPGGG